MRASVPDIDRYPAELDPFSLILAIIQQAERDLRHGTEQEKRAAYRWLFLEEAENGFLWCCEATGLDPVRVRRRITTESTAEVARLDYLLSYPSAYQRVLSTRPLAAVRKLAAPALSAMEAIV